ncbi:hypothetical protein [Edaphosphingomonas haloaromaticamans]|uniref:Uncharacterized protein n=1 Tax=Edaphosphingomonas haloaromaticamans TaxID=653954 RepID=A0A1S1HHJ0_9SPHN|nr:hypothetical protein [Sphingomonas haloaromaticamans]OHT21705.1 hypothetical protein BHE75_03716 [Sphingomonas haloaromaticamans]
MTVLPTYCPRKSTAAAGVPLCALLIASLLLAGCIPHSPPPKTGAAAPPVAQPESKIDQTGRRAGEIVTQPVRDVGVAATNIPPVLERASENPYSLDGLRACTELARAVTELSAVLGPDFIVGAKQQENSAGKFAEAGGQMVVNSLIPFRGLVREATGAAPAQRRLNTAIDAGFARRGFLRGIHQARGCRPPL